MEVCKTDIKNIIQFLEESASLIDAEAVRRNQYRYHTPAEPRKAHATDGKET